jgi:L-iditol 2-dehydrogenase
MNGGFAEYSIVPASQAYRLPRDFPAKVAAFAEPLSCCLRGIQQAAICMGNSVAIVGGGTIGLLMLQLARLNGAGQVLLIEPISAKREIARQLSADGVFDSTLVDLEQQINDITGGGADIVIECVGSSEAAQLSMKLAKRGGCVILFGLADKTSTLSLNLQDIFHRELTIKSSLLNPFTFEPAVKLLVSQKIKVEPLHPESIKLPKILELFSQPRNNSTIKYQVMAFD